eukprot:gene18951-13668_t
MRAGTPWEIGSCAYQLLHSMRYHVNESSVPRPQLAYFEDTTAVSMNSNPGWITTE